MANLNINLQQYEFQKTFEQLPTGWYSAVITESEVVETAAKDGFRLKLTFEIIDGPFKGRKVENGYNIQNKSQQAMDISFSELKTIAACIGIFATLQDSQQMHNQPLQIRLVPKKDSDYNDVKGYKTIQGEDPGKAVQAAPMQHQQQPAQGFAQPPASAPYADPTAGWTRQNGHRLNPATNAWEPDTAPPAPAPPPPPPPAAAAPAWAPPVAPAAPQAPPAPVAGYQPPAAPAWAPNPAPPQAPSWQPNK